MTTLISLILTFGANLQEEFQYSQWDSWSSFEEGTEVEIVMTMKNIKVTTVRVLKRKKEKMMSGSLLKKKKRKKKCLTLLSAHSHRVSMAVFMT